MAESYPHGWKTLWEKEKLLVTSNFSFSHSVFKRLVSQGRQKVSLCGNGLTSICKRIIFVHDQAAFFFSFLLSSKTLSIKHQKLELCRFLISKRGEKKAQKCVFVNSVCHSKEGCIIGFCRHFLPARARDQLHAT